MTKRSFVFLFLISSLLLFVVANAQICGGGTVTLTVDPFALIGVAALALSVSLDVNAIGYIIGRVFPQTGLSSWVREEYWEVAKSLILLVGIYSLLLLLGNLSNLLIGAQGILPSQTYTQTISEEFTALTRSAETYLQYVYCGFPNGNGMSLSGAEDSIQAFSWGIGALGSLKIGYYIPIPLVIPPVPTAPWLTLGTQFEPYTSDILTVSGGQGNYQSILNDAVNIVLMPVVTLVLAQYYLLPGLVVMGLAILIPLGLIFRALPFLRSVGGTLVALGMGVALVYPTILVLLNAPVLQVAASLTSNPAGGGSCQGNGCWVIDLFTTAINAVIAATKSPSGSALLSFGDIFYGLNLILSSTLLALVQLLLFALDLMIGYPITNGIARALGGTIDLRVGGKLKIT